MTTSDNSDPNYDLGYTSAELRRLSIQHEIYGSFTRQLLVDAGISPGMKVLDVGSGAGDVSMLTAELVGESGKVVGIEINAQSVDSAQARVRQAGFSNISFEHGDVREADLEGEFDAVIGRWVLMWVADPVAILAAARNVLKPDGVMAFQESQLTFGPVTFPETNLIRQIAQWNAEMIKQGGPESQMGYKLYKTFIDAGLPAPSLVFNTPIGAGPSWGGYEYVAETMRSLFPRIQELGLAGASEIDIDTLGDRIRDEAVAAGSITTMPPVIGAWSRNS